MGLAAGLLQSMVRKFMVWNSAGSESAGQNESADAARARASDGDGGTGPRSKSGRGRAASPDNQSWLRWLRSAARIGAPPRPRRENDGSDFACRRSRDRSSSINHGTFNRLRHKAKFTFNFTFNARRDFYRDDSDGGAAPVVGAAIASALKLALST